MGPILLGLRVATQAAIPSLVRQDDLVAANGRIQASYSAASVVGPLLAGLLLSVVPVQALLLVDALSFLLSAFSLTLVRRSFNGGEKRAPTSARADIVEGLRYVLGHPVLRNISIMMALCNFLGSSVYAQLVLFAKRRLAATDTQVGLLYAAGSVGIVVLSLAAGPLRKRFPFSKVALTTLMLEGALTVAMAATRSYPAARGQQRRVHRARIVAMAATRSYPAALVIWALAMGVGVLFNINTGSLRQAIVPNGMLGRVRTIAGVLAWSAIPVGTFAGGLLIAWTRNVALVYGLIGVATIVIPLLFSFTALGHAERYLPAPGQGQGQDAAGVPTSAASR